MILCAHNIDNIYIVVIQSFASEIYMKYECLHLTWVNTHRRHRTPSFYYILEHFHPIFTKHTLTTDEQQNRSHDKLECAEVGVSRSTC